MCVSHRHVRSGQRQSAQVGWPWPGMSHPMVGSVKHFAQHFCEEHRVNEQPTPPVGPAMLLSLTRARTGRIWDAKNCCYCLDWQAAFVERFLKHAFEASSSQPDTRHVPEQQIRWHGSADCAGGMHVGDSKKTSTQRIKIDADTTL